MPVPIIVIAIVIRVTPIIVRLVASQLAKQAMKTIASKWPKIKVAIDTALDIKDIAKDAKEVQKKTDAYFKQAKIIDDIRLDIERQKTYRDFLTKNIVNYTNSIPTINDPKLLKNTKDLIKASKKSLKAVENKLVSLQQDLTDESSKLDTLAIQAADAGIALIKTVASKTKKKKGKRGT